MARTKGSKNKPKTIIQGMSKADLAYHDRIKAERDQLADELKVAITEVEWYRKQVNHFLALLNIVIRGQ